VDDGGGHKTGFLKNTGVDKVLKQRRKEADRWESSATKSFGGQERKTVNFGKSRSAMRDRETGSRRKGKQKRRVFHNNIRWPNRTGGGGPASVQHQTDKAQGENPRLTIVLGRFGKYRERGSFARYS